MISKIAEYDVGGKWLVCYCEEAMYLTADFRIFKNILN